MPNGLGQRRLALNVLWLILDRGLRLAIAFAVSVWVAKRLEPAVFGVLSYANATVGVLSFLATLGIEAVVVRMLVEEPERRMEILSSAMLMRFLGGASTIAVSYVVVWLLQPDKPIFLLITPLIATASMFQAAEVVEYWLRQRLLSHWMVIVRQAVLLLGAGARLLALTTDRPLVFLALIQALEGLLIALALLTVYQRLGGQERSWQPRLDRVRMIFRQSLPLLISAISVALYARVGVLFLGHYHSTNDVGIYTIAALISEATHALPFAIMASYAPILLAIRKSDPENFDPKVYQCIRFVAGLGLVVALLFTLTADWVVPFLFGAKYAAGGVILMIHVWSAVFVFVSTASEPWFMGHGNQVYFIPKTLLGAVTNVLLNLWLVPDYGAKGVAIATVISYSVSAYFANAIFPKTRPLFRWQTKALCLMPWHDELTVGSKRVGNVRRL